MVSSDWKTKDGKLQKDFECNDFAQAITFVDQVAIEAEKLDHHPDILVHAYKKVRITLHTHNEDKITDKDYHLADKIDALLVA